MPIYSPRVLYGSLTGMGGTRSMRVTYDNLDFTMKGRTQADLRTVWPTCDQIQHANRCVRDRGSGVLGRAIPNGARAPGAYVNGSPRTLSRPILWRRTTKFGTVINPRGWACVSTGKATLPNLGGGAPVPKFLEPLDIHVYATRFCTI